MKVLRTVFSLKITFGNLIFCTAVHAQSIGLELLAIESFFIIYRMRIKGCYRRRFISIKIIIQM